MMGLNTVARAHRFENIIYSEKPAGEEGCCKRVGDIWRKAQHSCQRWDLVPGRTTCVKRWRSSSHDVRTPRVAMNKRSDTGQIIAPDPGVGAQRGRFKEATGALKK
jgi:hypothetical protein